MMMIMFLFQSVPRVVFVILAIFVVFATGNSPLTTALMSNADKAKKEEKGEEIHNHSCKISLP